MKPELKPIAEQSIVITGASSGIGLTTARMACARGARVTLAARNGEALADICDDLRAHGGQATWIAADVSKLEDVERLAQEAIKTYGGIDTWVNDAAVAIYGRIEHVSLDDQRRLFDINYWGVVHGSLTAVRNLRGGGALINMGSILSDIGVPLQGPYVAAKHAVKGFTDSLRMELEAEGAPISVTLIKPASINTPYMDHAKNYLSTAPRNPGINYSPQAVAEAILHAAEHPVRDIVVGGTARFMSTFGRLFPRLNDYFLERFAERAQRSNDPPNAAVAARDNLYSPKEDGHERSHFRLQTFKRSRYTQARLHPGATALVAIGAGAAATFLWRARRS